MHNTLISMFALTGKPSYEQLKTNFDGLKEVGMNEIMLYARSGCQLEYMSEEWLDTIGNAITAAKENGMKIWLYDDYNWPSGFMGGKVTEHPEFRLKSIETTGENAGEIVYNTNPKCNTVKKNFPDLFSKEAVEYFINNTHEVYYKRFKEHFGKTIVGIFTDEPSIGHYCLGTRIPYYDGMEKDYKDLCGGDFFSDVKSADDSFYKYAMQLVSNKFCENYLCRISRWCEERGIKSTGHLMEENEPNQAARKNGDILKAIRSITLPAIDEVYTNFEEKTLLSLLGVAQYGNKGEGVMAEIFALGPCDISFGKRRAMIYLMASFGVNRFLHTLYHLDFRGNTTHSDYFTTCTPDQPDFAAVKLLKSEADLAAEYAAKDFNAQVYIEYPTTYSQIKSPFELNTEKFCELVNRLSFSGIQWKFIAEGEIKTDAPVIRFIEDFNCVFSGKTYTDFNALVSDIDASAKYEKGVFTRRYCDGSFLKINLNTFEIITEKTKNYEFVSAEKPSFSVKYKNQNTIRAMFINGQTKAQIESDAERQVIFSVRKGVPLKINDTVEPLKENAPSLSRGFCELYSDTGTLKISKGITNVFSEDDYKYLPSVFLSGDFSARAESSDVCRIIINERKKDYACGEYIEDFGGVEFTARTVVPKGVTALYIGGTKLYTQVFINGKLTDETAFSPYVFDLGKAEGEVELKIVQYSSISAIFGDVEYFEKNSDKIGWRGTPSPDKTRFGFTELNWVK